MADAPQRFTVPKRPQREVTFELESPDGELETYTAVIPKRSALALSVADGGTSTLSGLLGWLDAALPEEQSARLEARLRDLEDDLDVETLAEVTRWLIEQATARPTE